jgi:hypothetical protein
LISLPLTAYSAPPQKSVVSFTGTIFADGTNSRIANASTTLCDEGGSQLQQSSSRDDGEFSFQGLQPGRYLLKVQASGFEAAGLHVDLSFASQRGFSVMLKPVRDGHAPAPGGQTVSAHELAMPEASRDLFEAGKKKLYVEKNAQAALRDFQSSTQKAPGFYEAYYQAGIAYLSLQNPAEAESHFRKSVDLSNKQYPDADIALATLLLQRGEAQQGEPLLRQGLALNPRSWQGQFALGQLEASRGHLESALAAAEQAATLATAQPVVYRLLAVIHLRQKDYPALLADLDAYLRLDPDSPAGLRAKELRAQTQLNLTNPQVSAEK